MAFLNLGKSQLSIVSGETAINIYKKKKPTNKQGHQQEDWLLQPVKRVNLCLSFTVRPCFVLGRCHLLSRNQWPNLITDKPTVHQGLDKDFKTWIRKQFERLRKGCITSQCMTDRWRSKKTGILSTKSTTILKARCVTFKGVCWREME